jgi:hypothetical protein
MTTVRKQVVQMYVDRVSHQWIVLGCDGIYWAVPAEKQGWDRRQRFVLTDQTELEPIPTHYKYLLGLPS